MNIKEKTNMAELARSLDWKVHGREYKHLLILLEYISLNEALTLMLTSNERTMSCDWNSMEK
jgi:hypothetical protein